MTQYIIEIPDWHPTLLNKLINSHWYIRNKLKKKDYKVVMAYCSGVPKARCKRLVDVVITLGKGNRRFDPDAAHKSLNDSLVNCGMLIDDSSEWCEYTMPIFKRGDRKSTLIILTDIV